MIEYNGASVYPVVARPVSVGEERSGWVSIDLELVRHEGYLEVIISGEYELEEAKRAFTRLVKLWTAEHMALLLVDMRPLVMPAPLTLRERFDFAQHAARVAIDARARGLVVTLAVFLGTEEQIDPRRFGIVVALNRGAKARATTDEAEALAWLGVEQPERPSGD
jgi:hypothetical protein